MVATAYSNLLYQPKVLNYEQDLGWLDKVAEQREQMDDAAYRYLDNLKAKALNIRFLNPAGQQKVDQYNGEITAFFKNNDLNKVDLSDAKTINSYAKIFDKIAGDTSLNNAYYKDKQMQDSMSLWSESAKNPGKTGYNKDNENVWKHEHLLPYLQEKDVNKLGNYDPGHYDPEYDYNKELKSIKGNAHFDGQTLEYTDASGNKQRVERQYLSAEKLNTIFAGGLSTKATNQMLTEGKSAFYNGYDNSPDKTSLARSMYVRDKTVSEANAAHYTALASNIDGRLKLASPEQQKVLEVTKSDYLDKAKSYQFNHSEQDYLNMDKTQLANQYAANYRDNRLNKESQGMAYNIEKVTNSLDPVFRYHNDYNFAVQKFNNLTKQQGFDNNIELEKLKMLKEKNDITRNKAGKSAITGSTLFSFEGEGNNSAGGMTQNELDTQLNQYNTLLQKQKDGNITQEELKFAFEHQDDTYNKTLVKAASLAGVSNVSGIANAQQLGEINQFVSNDKKYGELSNYFSNLSLKRDFNQSVKDETWNAVLKERGMPTDNNKLTAMFEDSPMLANSVLNSWNLKIASKFTSIGNKSYQVNLEKDKEHDDKNGDLIASIFMNKENQGVLNTLFPPSNNMVKGLTKHNILGATFYPDKLNPEKSTLAVTVGNLDKDNKAKDNTVYNIKLPTAYYKEFNVESDPKDIFYLQTKKYENTYNGVKYSVHKVGDLSYYKIMQPGKPEFNSAQAWVGEGANRTMKVGQGLAGNLTDIERDIKTTIDSILKK